jgi:hypothetical protein
MRSIAQELKEFRDRYNLKQWQAWQWCYLRAGTYRDYEQGRSQPDPIKAIGIRARIAAYEQREDRLSPERLRCSAWAPRPGHDFYDLDKEPDGSIIFRGVIPSKGQ